MEYDNFIDKMNLNEARHCINIETDINTYLHDIVKAQRDMIYSLRKINALEKLIVNLKNDINEKEDDKIDFIMTMENRYVNNNDDDW